MSHSKCTLAEANYALIGNYSLSVVIVDIGEFNKQQVSQLLNHIQQSIAAYAPPPIITEKVLFWVGYTNEVKQKKQFT